MDLVRSVTKRVKRADAPDDRVGSARRQISMPIALLSTTNPLTNVRDLADIHNPKAEACESTSPSTPTRSSLDDDSNVSSPSTASTPATSVGESSPDREYEPVSGYFNKEAASIILPETNHLELPPCIPQRALSHSKREHERLARKRSLQFSRPSSDQSIKEAGSVRISTDDSIDVGQGNHKLTPAERTDVGTLGPFTRELEQLSEVAEEFGAAARDAAVEDDLEIMRTRGLLKFGANDYVTEIQPLWDEAFYEHGSQRSDIWI